MFKKYELFNVRLPKLMNFQGLFYFKYFLQTILGSQIKFFNFHGTCDFWRLFSLFCLFYQRPKTFQKFKWDINSAIKLMHKRMASWNSANLRK